MWYSKRLARAIILFARLLTGMQARSNGCLPAAVQCIYFANRSNHGDFVLIRGGLPPDLRGPTRRVAGADCSDDFQVRGTGDDRFGNVCDSLDARPCKIACCRRLDPPDYPLPPLCRPSFAGKVNYESHARV